MVTVIIPALNEAQWIVASVQSAFAAGASEVIVADGRSSDATAARAEAAGARVVVADPPRARQLNAAVEVASHDCIIFLHADTTLPAGAAAAVEHALRNVSFGGFRIAFTERSMRLRIAAALINRRTTITRCPWGDQAQFIRREAFRAIGGFRDMPIMEDYDLALRMRGSARILPLTVHTSGRRFLQKGLLRTALTNWRLIASYHRGTDPAELARVYRA